MLTETFVSATLSSSPTKSKSTSVAKDAGIHFHDFQPTPALKKSFKKSSTPPNCLAVSVSHVFAAQADKAVVHVYSRERGNQEATVPFPERIHSVALAGAEEGDGGGGVLVVGTEEGRLVLWEVCIYWGFFSLRRLLFLLPISGVARSMGLMASNAALHRPIDLDAALAPPGRDERHR